MGQLRFSTIGTDSSHQRIHGFPNSKPMPPVWSVTLTVVTNGADSTMRINFPMVDPSVSDVKTMLIVTTVRTPLKAQSKSRPVTVSGLSDTCLNALVNVTTNIRSTALTSGTTFSKL